MITPLSEIIRSRIIDEGPVSFRDFMEMALYHPLLGYYTSSADKIGEKGDYYTCPYFNSLLGEMLAKQMEEMWRIAGKGQFTIVEYGAGSGVLCRDILNQLKQNNELYGKLNYCIIEKSAAMREKEKAVINEKITWLDSIRDVEGMTGCILSNELLDNFSVHRVVMRDELMEVFVDHKDGFKEVLQPASQNLKHYLSQLNVSLPEGHCAEINMAALEWMNDIAASLKKGFLLTIDYGFPSEELYTDRRRNGTLVCYARHKVNNDPYMRIGEQDITAHVNFSALCHWGANAGLQYCGYTSQGQFLHSLGLAGHLREKEKKGELPDKKNAFLAHSLLTDMGSKFKVLIQQKGMNSPVLSGMQFAPGLM